MPIPQGVQFAAPLMSEYVPVSQGEQVIVPELGADEPGAHEVQALEPAWSCGCEFKSNIPTGILQFAQPFCLPLFFAALRDCDVDHLHPGLSHYAQGQPASDTFVIRMWGKENRAPGGWRNVPRRQRPKGAFGVKLAFVRKASVLGHKALVRIHYIRYGDWMVVLDRPAHVRFVDPV